MITTDIAVIGAGSAGLSVAAGAAQLGAPIVLVEPGRMGGDCLNTGCVPSKALLAAAQAAHAVRTAHRFGVRTGPPEIDFDAVRAHVRHAIAEIAPNDSEERFTGLGATVLRTTARFLDARTLETEAGERIAARRIVVAAGARPALPPIPGLASVAHLTSETLWDNPTLPPHLLVLGGGAIGVEMAFAHARLGSQVTLVEAACLLPRDDPELVEGLRPVLAEAGIAVREHCRVARVEPGPVLVVAEADGGERHLAGSHLLVATGRTPNTEALALERGGVAFGKAGIAVDRGLVSISNRHVFAAGDIADVAGIGPRQFTHVAGYHAGIILRRALFRLPAKLDYSALPRVTFTDPELAQVGMTEAEACAAGHVPRIARWPLAENDRAVAEGATRGLVKLVADRRGRLLGAGILAPHAGEMIAQLGTAMRAGVTLAGLAQQIIAYPTRAEAAKRAAGTLLATRLFAPRTKRLVAFLRRFG
jgi:pyruvate/2-oxoglutarate dehydrogenase complex dihydrolipoamide dehydrogenase (E3) component